MTTPKAPEPVPVTVETSVPITVETETPLPVAIQGDIPVDPNRNPSTTSATPLPDALKLAAQRRNKINLLWELTQAFLALTLTLAAIYSATISTRGESETLKNGLFVVIGFYFGRTNHARPTALDPDHGTK